MEGTYEVIRGGQVVGSVNVSREGLYYRFVCRCRLSTEVMFRLVLQREDLEQDLGILIPMDGCFGLRTLLSVKKAGQGSVCFLLRPKREPISQPLVPVCPEEPFEYLSRLESAYLVRRGQEKYVAFHGEK